MSVHLLNRSKNKMLASQLESATSFWQRSRGLLGRTQLESNRALWIRPCNSIHTCFMKFSIDAIFVDRELIVRQVKRGIPPWRIVMPVWGAHSVFELPENSSTGVEQGDQLYVGD